VPVEVQVPVNRPYPVEVKVPVPEPYPVEVPVAVEAPLPPVDPLLPIGAIPFPVGNPIPYPIAQLYPDLDCLYPGQVPSALLSGFYPSPLTDNLPIHRLGHHGKVY
jgi:hypothetical protein